MGFVIFTASVRKILDQPLYSSKPTVALSINLCSTKFVCFAGFSNTVHFKRDKA